MKAILSCGGQISQSECKVVIAKVSDAKSEILTYALENCSPLMNKKGLNALAVTACKLKKLHFLSILLKRDSSIELADIFFSFPCSAIFKEKTVFSFVKSDETGLQQLIRSALDRGEFNFLESKKCILISSTDHPMDLSVFIQAYTLSNMDMKDKCFQFIKSLLDDKMVNPDGINGKLCPLDKVLELPKTCNREKIDFICLLLQSGANIQHCKYPRREQTTIIHIATQIAMDESKLL